MGVVDDQFISKWQTTTPLDVYVIFNNESDNSLFFHSLIEEQQSEYVKNLEHLPDFALYKVHLLPRSSMK